MARIRSVKPEFWDDRKLARRASRDTRLLYIGLWNFADEWGRCIGDPAWIKGKIFPYDDDIDSLAVTKMLDELAAANDRVIRYEVDDDPYLLLPKLLRHQRLETGTVPSRYPEPPDEFAHITDLYEAHARETARDTKASGRRANKSARDTDDSVRDADESALLYVAGSREQVAGSRETPAAEPRDDVDRLCDRLASRIEANGSKRPAITRQWRDAARLMIDRDKRTEEQIRKAIDWCQDSEFWRSNILSMGKLREKYDQLRLQAKGDTRQRDGVPQVTHTDEEYKRGWH